MEKLNKHADEFNLINIGMLPNDFIAKRMVELGGLDVPAGAIVECGVYRGRTSVGLHLQFPDRKMYLLDSFAGYYEVPEDEVDYHPQHNIHEERFTNNSPRMLERNLNIVFGRDIDFEIIPGYFEEWPEDFTIDDDIAILYIDCDLYNPIMLCLERFWPKLVDGGIACFPGLMNKPDIKGVVRAVKEFFPGESLDKEGWVIRKVQPLSSDD